MFPQGSEHPERHSGIASPVCFNPDQPILEFRRYRCYPGRRDAVIKLFAETLAPAQLRAGCILPGTFASLDDPDLLIWFRGFNNQAARQSILAGFYGGPDWLNHAQEALSGIADYSDVLLLQGAAPVFAAFEAALRTTHISDTQNIITYKYEFFDDEILYGFSEPPGAVVSVRLSAETTETGRCDRTRKVIA